MGPLKTVKLNQSWIRDTESLRLIENCARSLVKKKKKLMWDVTAVVHSICKHNQPRVTKGSAALSRAPLQFAGMSHKPPAWTCRDSWDRLSSTLTPGVAGGVAAATHGRTLGVENMNNKKKYIYILMMTICFVMNVNVLFDGRGTHDGTFLQSWVQ